MRRRRFPLPVLLASFLTLPLLTVPVPAAETLEAGVAATIETIHGKKTIEVKGSAGPRTASRGDRIQAGDTITTEDESVVLTLRKGNELQIAPRSVLVFEEVADSEEKRDILFLQSGVIWGLVAVGYSLSDLFYLRTPDVAIGVPAANFVVEFIPSAHSFTVLTLEGNVKIAQNLGNLGDVKRSTFVASSFRNHCVGNKIGSPKKFKRNLLISYLAHRAKEIAKDMANRGNRILTLIAKKHQPALSDDNEILWNNVQGLAPRPSTGPGLSPLSGPTIVGLPSRSYGSGNEGGSHSASATSPSSKP